MSDDTIYRKDAIKALKREKSDWNCDYNVPIDNCIKRLNKVKSADRPQGEWRAVDSYSAFGGSEEQWYAHGNPTAYHYCSVCKEQVHLDEFGEEMLTNFCPNCGSRMRGGKDD